MLLRECNLVGSHPTELTPGVIKSICQDNQVPEEQSWRLSFARKIINPNLTVQSFDNAEISSILTHILTG